MYHRAGYYYIRYLTWVQALYLQSMDVLGVRVGGGKEPYKFTSAPSEIAWGPEGYTELWARYMSTFFLDLGWSSCRCVFLDLLPPSVCGYYSYI